MRLNVISTMFMLFLVAKIAAASEEKVITAPFPQTAIDSTAHNFFCNAALGTVLRATSKESKLVSIGVEKAELSAKAHQATDKLILEISDGKLYLFERQQFENGKTTRDFPFEIIENSETNLVAIATGLIKPKGVQVLTLNRKTGIGSWTVVMSVGLPSDSPRIEAMYLTCGSRKD